MKKRKEEMPADAGDEFEAFEEWEGEEGEEEEGGEPGAEDEFLEEEGDFAEEGADEEFAEEEPGMPAAPAEEPPAAAPEVPQPPAAKLPEEPAPEPGQGRKLDMAALDLAPDVPVQVVAVIGKRSITMKDLMELRMGQVIDLKRPPNETVDVVVGGKLFARGELVEIDGKLGVKILKMVR